jgi:hypothetical protein
MARELDVQLLEAVAVRRGRLRESLLWGGERRRRAAGDTVKRFVVTYRWNTEIVPDAALRAEADAIAAARDALR